MSRSVFFGEYTMDNVDEGLSIAQVQEVLAEAWPSIKDATGAEDEDGNYVFTAKAAEKGC
jgi:hypothetical protein